MVKKGDKIWTLANNADFPRQLIVTEVLIRTRSKNGSTRNLSPGEFFVTEQEAKNSAIARHQNIIDELKDNLIQT